MRAVHALSSLESRYSQTEREIFAVNLYLFTTSYKTRCCFTKVWFPSIHYVPLAMTKLVGAPWKEVIANLVGLSSNSKSQPALATS